MTRVHAQERGGRKLKWIVLALAAALGLTAVSFFKEFVRSRQIDREIASLREEADRLRAKNFEIRSLQAASQKDEFFEREARLKLNLKKEGERVVVLRKAAPGHAGTGMEAPEAWDNPKRWWTYFADRKKYDQYAAELRDD